MSKTRNAANGIAIVLAAVLGAGCGGGGGNVRPDAPTPARPAPPPEASTPTPDAPTPTRPATPPEASTSRIPGLGDYAPVEGSGPFRSESLGGPVNWAFDRLHVADAYARLWRKQSAVHSGRVQLRAGSGRIAVVDDGIDISHPELNPVFNSGVGARLLTRTGLFGASGTYTRGEFSHGTAVTSLIVAHRHPEAERVGDSFHGIAHRGGVVDVYGIPLSPPTDAPYEPPQEDLEDIARGRARAQVEILRAATAATESDREQSFSGGPVTLVNMSFGYEAMAEQYLDTESRPQMERGLETLLDFVKGAQGTIFVKAAGNENGRECRERSYVGCASGTLEATSPSFDAALPLWDRSGEVGKRWVAVVATNRENALADFSNRCGHAARWCLAAPGVDILVAYSGPNDEGDHVRTYRHVSGTSFAAPLVTGGLSVVKNHFGDTLTMEEVLARVYATANKAPDAVPEGSLCPEHLDTDGDRTDCELSSTHGQGLMDLERATRPVGATTGHGRLADAGGGAIADALAGVEPVVFDSLGYPFRQPLEAQVTIAASAPGSIPSFTAGDDAGRPSWAGLHWHEAARNPEAAMGSWTFAAATGGDGAIHSSGLAYAPHDGAWEAGWLAERDRVFGGRAEGT